uniref:Ig-like domain-containing protein n=1 Tax=Pundamilia nyererei TaxID=303518 RepID=A0A3B4HBQ3_9CICH
MKTLIFLVVATCFCLFVSERHTMTYIETAATGWNESPELTEVIFVNGQEFVHYKSSLKKMVPKTEWIEKTVDPEYWERERQRNIHNEQAIKAHVVWLMERLNQTSGVHILQWMYGCEWNEDTEEVTGFEILGYDGRDYVAFDLKTETYIASAPQAVITKHNWDRDKTRILYKKYFLTQEFPPSVSLLQKTPSSPISCHATGFFPNVAEMFWRKDGEELHEGVHKGEILPNNDETFQMSVDLKLSSVKPEDWERHECVFQFSGVNKEIVTKLDKTKIKTNTGFHVGGVIRGLAVLLLAVCIGIYFKLRGNGNEQNIFLCFMNYIHVKYLLFLVLIF